MDGQYTDRINRMINFRIALHPNVIRNTVPERYPEYNEKHDILHKEYMKDYEHINNELYYGDIKYHNPHIKHLLSVMQMGVCNKCKLPENDLFIDHIIPRGPLKNYIDNLQLLCLLCKQDKTKEHTEE